LPGLAVSEPQRSNREPGRGQDVGTRVLYIIDGVGVDHIAEVDFGGNLAAALRCLRVNGSIMIYATNGDREPRVPVRDLMQKNLAVYSMSLAGVPHPDRRRAQSDIAFDARAAWIVRSPDADGLFQWSFRRVPSRSRRSSPRDFPTWSSRNTTKNDNPIEHNPATMAMARTPQIP
jgi:hypothetical protein